MDLALKDVPLDSFPRTYQALLSRIQEVCDQFHIASLNRQIEACENLLQQDQLIDVAILGSLSPEKFFPQ